MDLGKIMIGIALVLLSACLLVSPSHATGSDGACTAGYGNATSPADAAVTPYSPGERDSPQDSIHRSAGPPIMRVHDTSHPPTGRILKKEPRAVSNDDHPGGFAVSPYTGMRTTALYVPAPVQ
jgi:hypothetical protein